MIRNFLIINQNYQGGIKSISQISIGPPLGLAYIASVLEKVAKVTIIDANALNLSESQIVGRAAKIKPDIIGITAVTPTIDAADMLAKKLKAKVKAPIVIGGPHATLLPKETLKDYSHFDFLVAGEGEYTFLELVFALNKNTSLKKVRGLAFRKGKQIIVNKPRSFTVNLDNLPFPARHLLPNKKYRTIESSRFTSIMAMRGCPARCIYCNVYSLFGNKLRKRSPKNVVDEMELCFRRYNVRFISFLDDTFTYDTNWVFELCDEIIKRGLKLKWGCLTRVDNVNEQLLRAMKKAGCSKIELGIESGSQNVLDYMKKGITVKQIKDAFRVAKKAGIPTFGFLILNMPVETKQTLAETRKLVFELNPDFLQVSFATPYPGTELYHTCKNDGLLNQTEWKEYLFLKNVVVKNKNISADELVSFKESLEREFYLRPKFILGKLLYSFRNGVMLRTVLWAGLHTIGELFGRSQSRHPKKLL